ncbi:unnamed protein product [Meganyctiphanes norvegica]|uniref:Actin-related protein 2/3 complex subunit n=1 Tax=Meganyctiphanes norvegica TaxID=48144 RepID=A0AAV2QKP1_MEGNR
MSIPIQTGSGGPMSEKFQISNIPITCHAWNHDRTKVALSLNNNEVNIYKRDGNKWDLEETLKGHDLRVTDIDWGVKTNRIVTCSADRNAYVWTQESDGKWTPTLVLLRIHRAATCVRWAPEENKFAVGSGARLISVCYFEKENNWWVSKHIKKPITSTITSISWHPNNVLLAAGSTDFKIRVFSAWVKDIEPRPTSTPWGSKMPMGNLMTEFSNSSGGGGFVNSVRFSPDGNKIAWCGHDSSISVVDSSKDMALSNLKTEHLPFTTVCWVSNQSIVAAGYGACPMLYSLDSDKLNFVTQIDIQQKKAAGSLSAMNKFKNLDRTNQEDTSDTSLQTVHQNTITGLAVYEGSPDKANAVSTVGADSQLVIWNFKSLEQSVANLRIS